MLESIGGKIWFIASREFQPGPDIRKQPNHRPEQHDISKQHQAETELKAPVLPFSQTPESPGQKYQVGPNQRHAPGQEKSGTTLKTLAYASSATTRARNTQ